MRGAAKSIVCIALLAAAQAAHADCNTVWPVETLLQSRAQTLELRGSRGAAARIPRDWLQALHITAERINAASGISTTLYLCDAREPNAFAWSEGAMNNIAVSLGMRDLIGDDWHAFAALLGHENAHLTNRHGARQQQRDIMLAVGEDILNELLAAGGKSGVLLGIDLTRIGAAAIGASYSREEEHEADAFGMRYAHCAGFNAEGALALQRKLTSASDFLSSHPSSAARIGALRGKIARIRAAGCG